MPQWLLREPHRPGRPGSGIASMGSREASNPRYTLSMEFRMQIDSYNVGTLQSTLRTLAMLIAAVRILLFPVCLLGNGGTVYSWTPDDFLRTEIPVTGLLQRRLRDNFFGPSPTRQRRNRVIPFFTITRQISIETNRHRCFKWSP